MVAVRESRLTSYTETGARTTSMPDNSVLTAAISAGAAVVTAAIALIVNHRGFGLLDSHINDINTGLNRRIDDMGKRIDGLYHRLDRIEADLKEFFKVLSEHDKRIQRLEDKQ